MTREEEKEEAKRFNKRIWISVVGKILDRDFNFDEDGKRWYYDDINNIHTIDEVKNVEILEEEHEGVVTKTKGKDKRKVSIGKGLVGAVLLGPAGAIIGGTQGKVKKNSTSISENVSLCDKLTLKITMENDELTILLISETIDKKDQQYKKQIESANSVLNEFETLAGHKFGIEETIEDSSQPETQDKYTKLMKLKELLDVNAITQEEFEQEKQKILNQE